MEKIFSGFLVIVFGLSLSGCGEGMQENLVNKAEEVGGSLSNSSDEMMGMNKKQKCTWSEDGKVMSVIYTDGGERMRTESQGTIVGDDAEHGDMFMINDGVWIYTWDNETKKGMKMKNVEMDVNDFPEMNEEIEYMDMVDADYEQVGDEALDNFEQKCEKWKVDEKMFVPPANVEFQDMSKMMENMQNSVGDLSGMCDLAPESEKAECLEGLKKAQAEMPTVGL